MLRKVKIPIQHALVDFNLMPAKGGSIFTKLVRLEVHQDKAYIDIITMNARVSEVYAHKPSSLSAGTIAHTLHVKNLLQKERAPADGIMTPLPADEHSEAPQNERHLHQLKKTIRSSQPSQMLSLGCNTRQKQRPYINCNKNVE